MNNRYVIPALIACAAHGALLFGFPKNPRPPRLADDRIIPERRFEVPVDLIDPQIVEASAAVGPREFPPPAPIPTGGEPVVIEAPGRFIVELPPMRPATFGDAREIVPFEFRPGEGKGAPGWGTDIIPSDALDNPPRARFQASPIYPFDEKRNGVPGDVLVDFEVDESGAVRHARIVRASARAFEEPTLRAVAKWRFEPGKRHGKVVPFRMSVPVIFSLNE